MAKRLYIRQEYTSSTGHTYDLLAITGANIITGKKANQFMIQLNRFKDHESVISGLAPCSDREVPAIMVKADMPIGLSPLEVVNALTEALAKKYNLPTAEYEEEANELTLEEYNKLNKQA